MASDNNSLKSKYFAAKSAPDALDAVLTKANVHFKQLETSAYLTKLWNSWRMYHGAYNSWVSTGHQITFSGEQGELVQLAVNHYRNIAQHMKTMITANRPSLETRAINTDVKSLDQTILANGLLDYYLREQNLEKLFEDAVEMAIVEGAGYIKMGWNATSGEEVDFDEELNTPIYEGDVEFSVLSPFDVVFDSTKESFKQDWILTRTFKNKYDILAKYPELADKIESLPTKSFLQRYTMILGYDDTDDIPVYEFFHKRTEAMPQGRYIIGCSSDVILHDGPLPYDDIPVFALSPSYILGTPFGYSPMFDLMPLQENINALYSTVATNHNAFGVQNVISPRGADVIPSQLAGGLNFIEYNSQFGKPEALQLTATPREIFDFMALLEKQMETLSGISSVTRGSPEASLRTGAALALVQSMSIQFLNGLQKGYVKMIEQTGTALLQMLKRFASTRRVAAIVGKNNQTELLEFKGQDLSNIQRVIVSVGNPLAKTVAGRFELANQFIQYGIVKDPREIFQLLNTGQIDTIAEDAQDQLLLVRSENEALRSGQTKVIATVIDDHMYHISKHKEVISDPVLRHDPDLLKRTLDHISEHLNILKTADPQFLQVMGQPSLMPPPAPPEVNGPQGPQNAPQQSQNQPNSNIRKSNTKAVMEAPGQVRTASPSKPAKPPQPFRQLPTNPAENQ